MILRSVVFPSVAAIASLPDIACICQCKVIKTLIIFQENTIYLQPESLTSFC